MTAQLSDSAKSKRPPTTAGPVASFAIAITQKTAKAISNRRTCVPRSAGQEVITVTERVTLRHFARRIRVLTGRANAPSDNWQSYDSRHTHDWLSVTDQFCAVEWMLAEGCPGKTYDVDGGAETGNVEFVHMLFDVTHEILDAKPSVRERFPGPPPASGGAAGPTIAIVTHRRVHDGLYAIDSTRAERKLGFPPTVALTTGHGRMLR